LEFLTEYSATLRPIALALDRLQREKQCYYVELLPTLLTTNIKLMQLELDNRMRHCLPLTHAVTEGFRRRISAYLSLDPSVNDSIMASISHPFFKLRWTTLVKESPYSKEELTKKLQETLVMAVIIIEREYLQPGRILQQQHP
jgi:hypothetical protein